MPKAIIDKHMDFCQFNGEQIAELWYKTLSTILKLQVSTRCLKKAVFAML